MNFNPLDVNLLLSGSQDASIKLFDMRLPQSTATFNASLESIRDVQFSPHNVYQFVSVAESGSISVWDSRRPDKCEKSWMAHTENVFSCDWHPEVRMLIGLVYWIGTECVTRVPTFHLGQKLASHGWKGQNHKDLEDRGQTHS